MLHPEVTPFDTTAATALRTRSDDLRWRRWMKTVSQTGRLCMTHSLRRMMGGAIRRLLSPLSDRTYLTLAHWQYFKRWPNFNAPRTLQEHIQAYVLNCRNPMLRLVADKVAARAFIAERIGSEYLVPILGVWDRADAVPLQSLPLPCVLKPSHCSGMVHLLRHTSDIDLPPLRRKLERWLCTDYSKVNREWFYRGIPPRVIAEQMLRPPTTRPM
jgi:TupA-like ATPgrasp